MMPRARLCLTLAAVLLLSACDRGGEAPPAAPAAPKPAAAALRERSEPVRWDEGFGAFWYKDAPLNAARLWRFDTGPQGFSAGGAELTPVALDGVHLVNRLPDSQLRSPSGLGIDGSRFTLVLVRLTRLSDATPWDGSLYWMTQDHSEQDAFHTKPFLGEAPVVNETVILAYDMANPLKGGDDWLKSVIDQVRIDTDDGAGSKFRLRQIAIVENPAPDVLKAAPRAPKAAEAATPNAEAAGLR